MLLSQPSIMDDQKGKKQAYLKEAISLFDSASTHSRAGDLQSAALYILKGLDQERRAGGVGPQILQLIKPRK